MLYSIVSGGAFRADYKKKLNLKDPIDKLVLKLVEDGELKVGFVELNAE